MYADHRYRIRGVLGRLSDARRKPRIATATVAGSVLMLFLARFASLHALEQTKAHRFWKTWLGAPLPSADSLGRIVSELHSEGLRENLGDLLHQFRRKKVLRVPGHGWLALILDGHESSASYHRCCPGCLQRRIQTLDGERIQYYHRNVTALLRAGDRCFLLDAEPQRPGEDEVGAALRLFDRIVSRYPRAFQVVLVDGLYAQAPFFRRVLGSKKHVIAVLKNEARDLMGDARGLFDVVAPVEISEGGVERSCWDIEGFRSWSQVGSPVRIVRSLETVTQRRKDGSLDPRRSEWIWVTTLSQEQASTRTVVLLGHKRWGIENEGFNELVNAWHTDHVFRHHPVAILNFTLMAFYAYNLFHAFISCNLNPSLRNRGSLLHWARRIMSDLYEGRWDLPLPQPP